MTLTRQEAKRAEASPRFRYSFPGFRTRLWYWLYVK